jgi:hypothetical protein
MIKVAREGKVLGDFEPSQVVDGLKSGELRYSDHFWQPGSVQWMPLALFSLPKVKKLKVVSRSDVKPTSEQEFICQNLPRNGQIMLINAYAGSGKTETLRLISERYPEIKFTYLCYNKDTAEKAKRKFPSNVKCKTIHSLAYAAVGRFYKQDYRMPSSREVMQKFGIKKPYLAVLALETIDKYCNSEDNVISGNHIGEDEQHRALILNKYPDLVGIAQTIWDEMIDRESPTPISHDGYLKLWSLGSPHVSGDVILHDESQDMNPVTMRILREQVKHGNPGLVIVGDSHQAIYGWRGAINSMEMLRPLATYERSLTASFRFGQKIANKAATVLKNLKNDQTSIVGLGPTTGLLPEKAYIGRRNSSLIAMAIERMKVLPESKFHFAGTRVEANWDPYYLYEFQKPLDLLNLKNGRPDLVEMEQMKKFESYDEVVALISGDDEGDGIDRELEWFIKNLIEPYGDELPELINGLRSRSVSPDAAEMSFSTAHRSKGLEWREVEMIDDFWIPREVTELTPLSDEEIEEVNAIYVAMTRASELITYGVSLSEWLDKVESADNERRG